MDPENHPTKRTVFTAKQEECFKRLQSEGLTGTGSKFQSLLDQAVRETDLPVPVVRSKVHNMQRGARAPKDTAAPARKHMQVRKISAYNLFCHLIGSKSNDKGIRQKIWARMWGNLTDQQKQWYYDEAGKLNNTPLSDLQGEQREAAINTSKDAIMYHMKRLQKLQPFHGIVILTDNETVWSSSCGTGDEVLEQQEVQIQAALSRSVTLNGIQPSNKKKLRDNLRIAAQDKLRKLHSQFCNQEEGCVFPYQDYISGNADFEIVGLPRGFVLKKPCDMGQEKNQIVIDSVLSIVARERENGAARSCAETSSEESEGLTTETESQEQVMDVGSNQQPFEEDYSCEAAMEVSSVEQQEENHVSEDMMPVMDSTTYEISVTEDSVIIESVTQNEESIIEGDITTVPHLSADEAMCSVQEMAKALEKNNSEGPRYEKDGKGKIVLRSILGKTIFQLWTVLNPGQPKSKKWFKGTVVEVKPKKFAIHFPEDNVFQPLTAAKATTGLSKGNLLLLD